MPDKTIEYITMATSPDNSEALLVTNERVPQHYIHRENTDDWIHCEAAVDWLLKHGFYEIIRTDGSLLPIFAFMTVRRHDYADIQAHRESFLDWLCENHYEQYRDYVSNFYGV